MPAAPAGPGPRLLDVGCGSADLPAFLPRRACRGPSLAVGLDLKAAPPAAGPRRRAARGGRRARACPSPRAPSTSSPPRSSSTTSTAPRLPDGPARASSAWPAAPWSSTTCAAPASPTSSPALVFPLALPEPGERGRRPAVDPPRLHAPTSCATAFARGRDPAASRDPPPLPLSAGGGGRGGAAA